MRKFLKSLVSILLLLVPTMYFGIIDKPVQMGCILVPIIIGVVIINLDELKNSIITIKTKNLEIQFKEVIAEATATIEQLKKTQFTLTKVATETLYRNKFWGGCSIDSSTEMIEELYSLANSINAAETINGPIKLAYERLISEAYGHLTRDIKDNEDKEKLSKVLDAIYQFKGGTNIFIDGKYIPSKKALKDIVVSQGLKNESMQQFTQAINMYDDLLNKYQSKFGRLHTVDNIV